MQKRYTFQAFLGILSLFMSINTAFAVETPAKPPVSAMAVAYAWPTEAFLMDLIDPIKTPTPPEIVVFNIGIGNGDQSILDATAEKLRARKAANGKNVKVLGYVYTLYGKRPETEVKQSIDRYLTPRGGKVRFDGIFFDEGTWACGPFKGSMRYRDLYRSYREYVWKKLHKNSAYTIINMGRALEVCYLDEKRRAADAFVTFEHSGESYVTDAPSVGWAYGWIGGNVVKNNQYEMGTEYDPSSFIHMVYNLPENKAEETIDLAISRHAGIVNLTDDYQTNGALNPWDSKPTYLNKIISYIKSLVQN